MLTQNLEEPIADLFKRNSLPPMPKYPVILVGAVVVEPTEISTAMLFTGTAISASDLKNLLLGHLVTI